MNTPIKRRLLFVLLASVGTALFPARALAATYSLAGDFSFADFEQSGCERIVGVGVSHCPDDVERDRGLLGNWQECHWKRAVFGQKWHKMGAR